MRITASGKVDTDWIPYQKVFQLELKEPGANIITVIVRNSAGRAAASGLITWLPSGSRSRQTPKNPSQADPVRESPAVRPQTQPRPPARSGQDLEVRPLGLKPRVSLASWTPPRDFSSLVSTAQANGRLYAQARRVGFQAETVSDAGNPSTAPASKKTYTGGLFGHSSLRLPSQRPAFRNEELISEANTSPNRQHRQAAGSQSLFGHYSPQPARYASGDQDADDQAAWPEQTGQAQIPAGQTVQSESPAVWSLSTNRSNQADQTAQAGQDASATQGGLQTLFTPQQALEQAPLQKTELPPAASTAGASPPQMTYQEPFDFGDKVADFLGVGGLSMQVGPQLLDEDAYLRFQASAQIPTASYRRGLRFDGTYAYSVEGNQLVHLNGTVGSKFFGGGQVLFTAGYLQRYMSADFPTSQANWFPDIEHQGGDMSQLMVAGELQYAFSKIPETDDPSLGIFVRGWQATVDSVLLGTEQAILQDGGLYTLEYGFGGGQETMLAAGCILGGKTMEIRPSLGVVSREYEEFLGHEAEEEQSPSGNLEINLKEFMGGSAGLYLNYDPDLQIYGGKFNIPISDAFALGGKLQYANSDSLAGEWQIYLGLQYAMGRIDDHGKPQAPQARRKPKDISWLRPVAGATQDIIRVARPLYRYTYTSSAGAQNWAQPIIGAIPDQICDVGVDFTLDLSSYTDERGLSDTTWSADGLPEDLELDESSGLISGQVTNGGEYTVTVQASNTFGAGNSVSFKIVVDQKTPYISEIPNWSTPMGTAFNLDISQYVDQGASNVTSFQALGLPPGLSIDTSSGVISGTAASQGTYTVKVAAYNEYGWSDYREFQITVTP
jgi:hypothetical protein